MAPTALGRALLSLHTSLAVHTCAEALAHSECVATLEKALELPEVRRHNSDVDRVLAAAEAERQAKIRADREAAEKRREQRVSVCGKKSREILLSCAKKWQAEQVRAAIERAQANGKY